MTGGKGNAVDTDVDLWGQLNAQLADSPEAELAVASTLARQLAEAEQYRVISAWFFVRKQGWWRLRYQPGPDVPVETATSAITASLARLRAEGSIRDWVQVIYEPEVHAFGGPDGMRVAHQLFHHDSRAVMAYRADTGGRCEHRRELSLLLATALLRAAGQEWFEQGDVWSRVVACRPVEQPSARPAGFADAVLRFLSVDTSPDGPLLNGGALAFAGDWMAGFRAGGAELGDLARCGRLTRGLRAVLAYLVLPGWNRAGLP
ncbi:thiopeptide-type bacteriocin biosynthesis protein [Micromonospora aurantiaca (nom. illeg.)]|uniref:thiopeptide-type bacteriocin biosynthesis protein n=1 Tax=Micromonospora aurantiaca (nom. illeg.) TaxID=47850 RepID=UPI003647A7B8